MNEFLNLISNQEQIIITLALLVNIMTGLLKQPIKKYIKNENLKIRLLTCLPFLISLLLSYIYQEIFKKSFSLNQEFIMFSISSSLLSVSIYTILENLFKAKKGDTENIDLKSIIKDLLITQEKKELEKEINVIEKITEPNKEVKRFEFKLPD